jgi:hypothetical protein
LVAQQTSPPIAFHFRMDCRVKPGNDDVKKRSRDASASEACSQQRRQERSLPARMIPKSALAVFGKDHAPRKRESGAPKGALSNQYPRQARLRAARLAARPPFGAHACGTRHRFHPMAQLQNRVSRGVG